MKLEGFSRAKRFVQVGDANVAYVDEGKGDPVLSSTAARSPHSCGAAWSDG